MCLFRLIFYEKYDWSSHSMMKCKFKKVNDWTTTTYALMAHGLNCRPGPCEGVAGAMSASPVVCKVVQFTVKQRQLHVSPPANELSRLLEPKLLATPAIGSSQSRIEVNISRQRRFEVKTQPGQCKTATSVLWIFFSDRYRVSIMYMIHSNVFFIAHIIKEYSQCTDETSSLE